MDPDFLIGRILLIEDSPVNRGVIKAFMKRLPLELFLAEDGRAGLEMALNNSFDLILLDIELPIMDGYVVASRLRDRERREGREHIPLIALTGGGEDTVDSAVFDGYVCKCSGNEVLHAELIRWLPGLPDPTPGPHAHFMDPLLAQHLPVFLTHTRGQAQALSLHIARDDRPAIRGVAHQIKGDAGTYGLHELSAAAAAIEAGAMKASLNTLEEATHRLKIIIDKS